MGRGHLGFPGLPKPITEEDIVIPEVIPGPFYFSFPFDIIQNGEVVESIVQKAKAETEAEAFELARAAVEADYPPVQISYTAQYTGLPLTNGKVKSIEFPEAVDEVNVAPEAPIELAVPITGGVPSYAVALEAAEGSTVPEGLVVEQDQESGAWSVTGSVVTPGTYEVLVKVTDDDGNIERLPVTIEVAAE